MSTKADGWPYDRARLRGGAGLLALFAVLSAGGCSQVQVKTPPGFVALDTRAPYDYRAVSAQGVVLAVRVEDSQRDQGGDLAFWAEAITRRMRRLGGYALIEARDVKSNQGLSGKQLRFGHDERATPYRYWISLFIDGKKLFVVEVGGPEPSFVQVEQALLRATASVR